MGADSVESSEPDESRWWYWIAAYPIVGLLFIPFAVLLIGLIILPLGLAGANGAPAVGMFAIALVLVVAVVAFTFVILALAVFVMLPIALYFDAQAITESHYEWNPDPFVYAIIGALQFFVTPLIGFIVAIYYLYRRHTDVGVP